MVTKVINSGRIAKTVTIVLEDGSKTSVRVMARGRVDLPEGSKVCGNWLALKGEDIVVKEIDDPKAASPVAQAAKDQADIPAASAKTVATISTDESTKVVDAVTKTESTLDQGSAVANAVTSDTSTSAVPSTDSTVDSTAASSADNNSAKTVEGVDAAQDSGDKQPAASDATEGDK